VYKPLNYCPNKKLYDEPRKLSFLQTQETPILMTKRGKLTRKLKKQLTKDLSFIEQMEETK
jgi:hypothetical protein